MYNKIVTVTVITMINSFVYCIEYNINSRTSGVSDTVMIARFEVLRYYNTAPLITHSLPQ